MQWQKWHNFQVIVNTRKTVGFAYTLPVLGSFHSVCVCVCVIWTKAKKTYKHFQNDLFAKYMKVSYLAYMEPKKNMKKFHGERIHRSV